MNDQYEEGREVAGISVESGTVAVLNRSEIEQQVTTAHKFPRSIKRFRQEALQMVTLNESVAESCIYALPRGNKTIEGPSARFAEVVASAWKLPSRSPSCLRCWRLHHRARRFL